MAKCSISSPFWVSHLKLYHNSRTDTASQILLQDYDFWQFSTPPGYVRVCGIFSNLFSLCFMLQSALISLSEMPLLIKVDTTKNYLNLSKICLDYSNFSKIISISLLRGHKIACQTHSVYISGWFFIKFGSQFIAQLILEIQLQNNNISFEAAVDPDNIEKGHCNM